MKQWIGFSGCAALCMMTSAFAADGARRLVTLPAPMAGSEEPHGFALSGLNA